MTRSDQRQHEDPRAHEDMLATLRAHGIRNPTILAAMARVPRHRFVPSAAEGADAYGDFPLPIGCGQTISQPFIVAYMSELLQVVPGARVLEIGTGSGYQAAVLAELGAEVYSVEIIPELATRARDLLAELGCNSVHTRLGNGWEGWPECAPYDGIIVTCCPGELPPRLPPQLSPGGRLVIPVGREWQRLVLVTRETDRFVSREDLPVRFVPMVGG